jgi:hypothetical protein
MVVRSRKLELDSLQVESFATEAGSGSGGGTVHGAEEGFEDATYQLINCTVYTLCNQPTCAPTCGLTCPHTCQEACYYDDTRWVTACQGGGGTGTSVQTCNRCDTGGGETATSVYPCGTATA